MTRLVFTGEQSEIRILINGEDVLAGNDCRTLWIELVRAMTLGGIVEVEAEVATVLQRVTWIRSPDGPVGSAGTIVDRVNGLACERIVVAGEIQTVFRV